MRTHLAVEVPIIGKLKRKVLILGLLARTPQYNRPMKIISAQDLKTLQDREDPFLLDVRTEGERLEGHLEDSLWIPMNEILDRCGEIPRDRPVYVYCRSGNRSGQVVERLAQDDYENLINVSGGILDYERVGGNIIRGSLGEKK